MFGLLSTTTDLRPAGDARAAAASLLDALVIVARHRGIHLSEKQLRRDHRLGPGEPTPEELLQNAGACGMRAAATRLGFRDLMELKRRCRRYCC